LAAENLDEVIADLVKKFAEVIVPSYCSISWDLTRLYVRVRIFSTFWWKRFDELSTATNIRI
jgi:hypothetical protein